MIKKVGRLRQPALWSLRGRVKKSILNSDYTSDIEICAKGIRGFGDADIIYCGWAFPHTDWDAQFLTACLFGSRILGSVDVEFRVDPGDIFILDASKYHWLTPLDPYTTDSMEDIWVGLQWELPKVKRTVTQILDDLNAIPV